MEKRERSSTPVKAPVDAPKAPVSSKIPAAPPSPPPGVAEVKEVKEKKKPEKKVAEEVSLTKYNFKPLLFQFIAS